MNVCPKCGCLNDVDSKICTMCHEPLEIKEKEKFIEEKPIEQPKIEPNNGRFFNKTFIDDAKIIEDKIEYNKEDYIQNKDYSTLKSAILSIIIIAIIIIGVVITIYLGWFNPKKIDEEILNSVVSQANNYDNIIINYLNKYDFYYETKGKSKYRAKNQEYSFVELNINEECKYVDGTYNNEYCELLFKDINNNYCRATNCNIPQEYDIKISVKQETKKDDEGNDIIVNNNSISNYTTLTYDDIICTKNNNKYICDYKK